MNIYPKYLVELALHRKAVRYRDYGHKSLILVAYEALVNRSPVYLLAHPNIYEARTNISSISSKQFHNVNIAVF